MIRFEIGLNQMRRKVELFFIVIYFFPSVSVGLVVQNFMFFSISNIWVSLVFLFPIILILISILLYKKNKNVDLPLILCSIYWIGMAGPKLFDDVSRSKISFTFFLFMTIISLLYPFFLSYLKIKTKSVGINPK